MSKKIPVFLIYFVFLLLSSFLGFALRWNSYLEPKLQDEKFYDENLTKNDPIFQYEKRDTVNYLYYKSVVVKSFLEAGEFPFLKEIQYDTTWVKYKRPINKKYN